MKHIALLILLSTATAFSQPWVDSLIGETPTIPTGSIHIRIIDSLSGNPIAAFVEVIDPRQLVMWQGLVYEEVTVSDLVVLSLPYACYGTWVGYFPKSVPATISSSCTTNVVISLVPIPPPTITRKPSLSTIQSSLTKSLAKMNSKTSKIYNIFGKRVDTPTRPGIYFLDGKKMIKK